MLAHHLRRWVNIKPSLVQRLRGGSPEYIVSLRVSVYLFGTCEPKWGTKPRFPTFQTTSFNCTRIPARWQSKFVKKMMFCGIIYGIRRSLNGLCSITQVKQRRARFIIGWETAWDCQVLYALVGLREPRIPSGETPKNPQHGVLGTYIRP